MNNNNTAAAAQPQSIQLPTEEEGAKLVIEAIQAYMPCLKGQELIAENITVGNTNLSYKVYCRDDNNDPKTKHVDSDSSLPLFAKLCFDRARWNPNSKQVYDLQRAVNEGEIMKRFGEAWMMHSDATQPPIVPTPYFVLDAWDGHAKVLVTEWARTTDVTLASQFVEGTVDPRVIRKAGQAFATLNLLPVEHEFNQTVKPFVASAFHLVRATMEELFDNDNQGHDGGDEAIRMANELGKSNVDSMISAMEWEWSGASETMVHSDAHPFNLLVEKNFGERGELTIVDWEMSCSGSAGQDAGKFQSFPIACAMAHAIQSRPQMAYDMIQCNELFWDAYAQVMVEQGGKTEQELVSIFRKSLGILGFHLFVVLYAMESPLSRELPLKGASPEDVRRARDAFGCIGLRLLSISCGGAYANLNLEELRSLCHQLIENRIEALLRCRSADQVERPSFSCRDTYRGFFLSDELEA